VQTTSYFVCLTGVFIVAFFFFGRHAAKCYP
jgi:hypothetical protein